MISNPSAFPINNGVGEKSRIIAGARGALGTGSDAFGPVMSSTPAVANILKMNGSGGSFGGDLKRDKAGLKLPVGSGNTSREDFSGGKKRVPPGVTVREHLISPIVPAQGELARNVQWTEPRGQVGSGDRRQLFGGDSGEGGGGSANSTENGGVGGGSGRVGFPYPRSSFEGVDSAEILRDQLQLLNCVKRMEGEKQRLFGGKKVVGKKENKKEEEMVVSYDFDKDTFLGVNSEAANHALHLVFNALDSKEAEHRFRDCWPVYEKKLEGIFRRVALDWIKQLVEENPQFFREIPTQSIGGLLVNPGGERFISFLRCLCRLTLYTLANRKKALIKQQVLLPPEPSSDPEIYNRQMHVLEVRTRQNAELIKGSYKQLLNVNSIFERRMKRSEESGKFTHRMNEFQNARLLSNIKNCPEYFGNPTEEDLQRREEALQGLKLREDIMEKNDYPDILRDCVGATLRNRLEKIYRPIGILQDVLQDFGKIWYILEMDKSNPSMELDCEALGAQGNPDWSLNGFLKSFSEKVNSLANHPQLTCQTSPEILQDWEAVMRRVNFLEVMQTEVLKQSLCDTSILKIAQEKRPVLKLAMDNFDWSLLSRLRADQGVGRFLDVTPFQKLYDINRVSGRTPAIQNFLDSSSSSSSGEMGSAVVVRRRAQGKRQLGRLSGLLQRSESEPVGKLQCREEKMVDDTTDGGIAAAKPPIGQTPLSSTQINHSGSISFKISGDYSLIATPTSAVSVSSSSSFRMKKSVSFGDTPTGGESSSFNSSVVSIRRQQQIHQRRSDRFSGETGQHNTTNEEGAATPLDPASREVSASRSGLSLSFNASGASTPVGLDNSTQERLNKLLQSLAVPRGSSGRQSLSPIAQESQENSESGAGADQQDNSNNDTKTEPEEMDASPEEESVKEVEMQDGALLNVSLVGLDKVEQVDFGDISIIEDFEEVKGIMETSYIEMFRNSDSDD